MEVAIDIARREGATLAKLNAQSTVESFYGGLGFASYGDIFEEDGIPHIAMQLSLDEACGKGG
jgi:predicted GNAT family N-acyltransferase